MPAARDGSCMEAAPELMLAVPSEVVPSKNATEPVGEPEFAETVAVRVTAWFVVAGLGDAASAVVVVAGVSELTVSATGEEVERLKLLSPPYCAVRVCEPEVIEFSCNVTVPELPRVALPMEAPPSKKVTVPVGVPEVAVTVAVSVMA